MVEYFASRGIDLWATLTAFGVLGAGFLLVGCMGRFIFGKRSNLAIATSSSIGILFIICVSAVVTSTGIALQKYLSPLPFVTITENTLVLFALEGADYKIVCGQALSMIILSFLVNLVDRWIPKGKNVFGWLCLRSLTVVMGMAMHFVTIWLLRTYVPADIMELAPVILLGILVVMILTGALKLVVGLVVSTVNPLIGAFYTFFFANAIGKLVTRAVLTTGLLMGLLYLVNELGVYVLSIAPEALMAYIPFAVILLALWYLVGKVF